MFRIGNTFPGTAGDAIEAKYATRIIDNPVFAVDTGGGTALCATATPRTRRFEAYSKKAEFCEEPENRAYRTQGGAIETSLPENQSGQYRQRHKTAGDKRERLLPVVHSPNSLNGRYDASETGKRIEITESDSPPANQTNHRKGGSPIAKDTRVHLSWGALAEKGTQHILRDAKGANYGAEITPKDHCRPEKNDCQRNTKSGKARRQFYLSRSGLEGQHPGARLNPHRHAANGAGEEQHADNHSTASRLQMFHGIPVVDSSNSEYSVAFPSQFI